MKNELGSSQIQKAKEKARRLALSVGLALERRDDSIETVDVNGNRNTLVENADDNEIWTMALREMQKKLEVTSESDTTLMGALEIYADGGSRGNPGPSASGFVLIDGATGQVLEEGGEYLGVTTNNQAEYNSLKLALQHASKYKPKKITVYMDSELVVKQLNGVYKIRNRELWPIHQAIKQSAEEFEQVQFKHVTRDKNTEADRVVNQILDRQKDKS